VWALFGDDWRPNPPIAEGTLVSAVAGVEAGWRGATSAFDGDAAVEWAPGGPGDFQFAQLRAQGRWSMRALWNHAIEVNGITFLPLGGDAAPPQRWSFVGGSNTLPTLERAALRGDHVVFVESAYAIPLPQISVPLLGVPNLRLVHATGTAWVTGADAPPWEQNLGVGLAFSLLEAMLYVDPAGDPLEAEFNLGLTLPF
jgi:hypothetical protein